MLISFLKLNRETSKKVQGWGYTPRSHRESTRSLPSQVVQNVWEEPPCTGTCAPSYPQGKGVTSQEKVALV